MAEQQPPPVEEGRVGDDDEDEDEDEEDEDQVSASTVTILYGSLGVLSPNRE